MYTHAYCYSIGIVYRHVAVISRAKMHESNFLVFQSALPTAIGNSTAVALREQRTVDWWGAARSCPFQFAANWTALSSCPSVWRKHTTWKWLNICYDFWGSKQWNVFFIGLRIFQSWSSNAHHHMHIIWITWISYACISRKWGEGGGALIACYFAQSNIECV